MSQDYSIFEFDPESGRVVYVPSESEVSEDVGDSADSPDEVRDVLDTSEDVSEDVEDTEEDPSGVDLLDAGDSGVPVVLSEDVTAAILASTPAGGSIGSTTLDYFDRVVSGLPADYKYIAYRTSSDNSYDAVLYYGRDFDISGNVITFDEGMQIEVQRITSSGYTTETTYAASEIFDTSVSFSQSGSVVYYTNATEGYPILGGVEMQKSMSFYIVPALIGALALIVMYKLCRR